MANLMTTKEYQEVKNKSVTVISFKDSKRTLIYSGLNYKKAIELMLKLQLKGQVTMIFENIPVGMDINKWDYSYFARFLGVNEMINNSSEPYEEMACPYCKAEFEDTSGLGDAGTTNCPGCNNKFNYERETYYSYTVEKLKTEHYALRK